MSILHYLKYFLFHVIGFCALATIVAGGGSIPLGLVAILGLYLVGDAIGGDDVSTPTFRHPGILTFQLWLALPLLALIVFASVWGVCTADVLGFGARVTQLTGYDVLAARNATSMPQHLAGIVLTGLMIGMIGTITAPIQPSGMRDG